MTLRHSLLLSVASVLFACGPQDIDAASSSTTGGEIGLTDNSPDAGPMSSADAGAADPIEDAGPPDAGPDCPALTEPSQAGCMPEVSVRLTGTAAVTVGDTLMAGAGQQPLLQAFVTAPPAATPSAVAFTVSAPDGGVVTLAQVTTPTTDDAGTHYDLALDTTQLPEEVYTASAEALVADGGFGSNQVQVLVDRAPPSLSVRLSNDGGVVARDAKLEVPVEVSAGPGLATLTCEVAGIALGPLRSLPGLHVPSVWYPITSFPALVAIDGSTAVASATLDLAQVAFDAWSTAKDGAAFEVTVTATDLIGNVATSTIPVPTTRALWTYGQVQGQLALGLDGQVLVNDGSTLHAILPDGSSQVDYPLGLDGGDVAVGLPATLAATGQTYLVADAWNALASQIVSVNGFGTVVAEQVPGGQLGGLALDEESLELYAVDQLCRPYSTNASLQGVNVPTGFSSPGTCGGATPMLLSGSLYEAVPGMVFTYDNPIFPPASSGAPPMIPTGAGGLYAGLFGGDPSPLGWNQGTVAALGMVTDSNLNVVTLDQSYVLSRVGSPSWSRQLGSGLFPGAGGVVVGSGGLIYAVDGNGTLSAFDAAGRLHWQSPMSTVLSPPMIDHCTSHAFVSSVANVPMAIAVDSPGVDASPSSWPMAGHDVFQSYDAASTYDVDCASHL